MSKTSSQQIFCKAACLIQAPQNSAHVTSVTSYYDITRAISAILEYYARVKRRHLIGAMKRAGRAYARLRIVAPVRCL